MRLFRKARQEEPELVELEVGYDRIRASMVIARCEAEDIPIRLLTMDEHGLAPGIAALAEHRILIRVDDRVRVEEIVQQGRT